MDPLNSSVPENIGITDDHWQQMKEHVQRTGLKEEACGLIAGNYNKSTGVFPATNILHSPSRFQIDPGEQNRFFIEIERKNWQLLAIYHSHPNYTPRPSETDIAEAFYPEAVHLIWFYHEAQWHCLGYRIQKGFAYEVQIQII
jgi:[CysO sulfur-carrier protein]-S-L-cysteine hydrolase